MDENVNDNNRRDNRYRIVEIKTKKNIEITRTEQMGVTRTSRTKTQKWKDKTRCAKIGPEKKAKTIDANQRQRQL